MLPPVYQTIRTPEVQAMVGTKIYRHGQAPQNVKAPYVTWFLVTGNPHENISDRPCGDTDMVQIDCWHSTDTGIEQLAYAVRDALDDAGISNSMITNNRDTDTKIYRIGLQADFISSR